MPDDPAAGRFPRRVTDRVEDLAAWVLTAGALLVVVGACLTGVAVYRDEPARVGQDPGSMSHTRVVLLEDAVVATGEYGMHHLLPTPVRWVDRFGSEHTGSVVMTRSAPAGTEVVVWVDATGKIAGPPLRPVNPLFGGAAAAFGVLCVGATVLVVTWLGVRAVTGRFNSRRWEREWARVEPLLRRTVL
jgi:hypothetical protein